MKKLEKTIAYMLALTCCFSGATYLYGHYNTFPVTVYAEKETEEKTFEDWSYVVYDKIDGVCDTPCIEITKHNRQGAWDAYIPAKIDGLPVVSIAGNTFSENRVHQMDIPSSIKRFGEGFSDYLSDIYTITIDKKLEFSLNFTENHTGASDNNDFENMTIESVNLTAVYPLKDKDKTEDIDIPETVCGFPVVSVFNSAFEGNNNIRNVKIPDTVEYFGLTIFKDSSVQSVNIPKALKVIPSNTFKNCKNLKSVEFHENVIVASTAFKDTDFKVPDNVNVSESTAYVGNSHRNITKKSGDFNITICYDNEANEYYGMIQSYTTDTVSGETIDIVFPETFCEIPIKEIHENFWKELKEAGINVSSITFPSEMKEISSLVLNNPETLKHITIKADGVSICQEAFQNTSIEEIVLNGSCTIHPSVFMNCKNLKKVQFTGDSPTITINHDAFRNCTLLEEVTFPENMTADFKIDSFRNCSSLKEISLNGKINVDSHAFRECKTLENLTLNGDINLGTDAFSDCINIINITVDTDRSINGSAFNSCVNLMNINSSPVYNPDTKDFHDEIKDFVFNNFNGADEVGFINCYVLAQVQNFAENYITDDMTDMQKIKTAHDWVCNNIVYDNGNISNPKNHNDASVFMNDSSVCEGYARCYNLLLNSAGIETYYLISDNHTWNIVKLGGHYFHSDTTWDDGDVIGYDWFLKSDSETLAETSAHSVWNFRTPSVLHNFQKETLPECKYSMGDLNTDGEINIADLVLLKKYLTGQSSVSKDDIVLADLTYDGVTDIFDLVLMRQLLLKK